jgi:hypothetical protein
MSAMLGMKTIDIAALQRAYASGECGTQVSARAAHPTSIFLNVR